MTMESKPISFVQQNMELFGFQNENEDLFTSFVELLDNCVDAVISNTSIDREEKEINICLTPSKSGGTYCFSTVIMVFVVIDYEE